jgi:hypothetical protein
MKPLDSELERVQESFDKVRSELSRHDFTLGGNWDYDHGYFDRNLDEAQKVWLRIPFEVITGRIEGDTEATDAVVQIGTPFVLKHRYNEGLDPEAPVETAGGLVNQFQSPVEPDAELEDRWIQQASALLKEIERNWQLN